MSKKETILLTGGTGFLGSHLLKAFLQEGYQVVIVKRTFSKTERIGGLTGYKSYDIDIQELRNIFEENKIDVIIHAATLYGRGQEALNQMIETNILFPVKLLELGIQHGVKAFINTDTFTNDKNNSHYNFLNNYHLTKSHLLDWLLSFKDKIKIINCKLWHIFGPYDDESKFIVHIIRNLLRNAPYLKLTDGLQKRDFIYVDDVVNAYITLIKNIDQIEIGYKEIEVGTGHSMPVREMVELIAEIANNTHTNLLFGSIPKRKGEFIDSKANSSALQQLGWTPQVSIRNGLNKTISWEKAFINKK